MNIFSQFIKSFYSLKTISAFRFQGIGKTILYIFVMILIVSLPVGTKITLSILNGSEKVSEMLTTDFPDFELKNGTLSSELSEPYIITDEDFTIIFDTTGHITRDDLTSYQFGFIFLEKEAIIIENGIQENYRYNQLGNITMSKTEIIQLVNNITSLLPIFIPILLLLLYLFVTAMKFIGVTFLAVIGIALKKRAQVRLNFKQLWTISAYAVTLPTAIFALLDAFNIVIPFSFILYWIIAVIILYKIINHVPKPKINTENH